MYTDCHIGAAADLFPRESFNMKRKQQTMLSFLSTAEKSRRQTGNNNFRKNNFKTNITCCSSSEIDDKNNMLRRN